MIFETSLVTGTLVKRYKRFLADVILESGELTTAHCTSTGAMLGLLNPGARVWLSPAKNPDRKLRYTWEMIESDGVMVGVNTSHPNFLVYEAIQQKKLAPFSAYSDMRREVKYGTNSRIDILLEEEGLPRCYIEIKNVHLKRDNRVEFPDAVTERGLKHLREMMVMVEQGHRAAMVYVVQRGDGEVFSLAKDIDPAYAEMAKVAKQHGVEFYAYPCEMTATSITLQGTSFLFVDSE